MGEKVTEIRRRMYLPNDDTRETTSKLLSLILLSHPLSNIVTVSCK